MKVLDFYDKTLCTALGVGYWPWGPGTAGAALATLLWWPIWRDSTPGEATVCTAVAIVIATALAIPSINRLELQWGPDPSRVVIDEVVGVWIALLAMYFPEFYDAFDSPEYLDIALAFIYFRFFDIVKPLGIRSMEELPGGWGVMADDILAGIYSFLLLLVTELFYAAYIYPYFY